MKKYFRPFNRFQMHMLGFSAIGFITGALSDRWFWVIFIGAPLSNLYAEFIEKWYAKSVDVATLK